MARFSLKKLFDLRKITTHQSTKAFDPKKAKKLKLVMIFVKKGHGVAINRILFEQGIAMSVLSFAEGAREKYVADILGGEINGLEVIFAVVPENKMKNLKNMLYARFTISNASSGAMIAFDIKSMAGLLAYKYLSDFGGASNYEEK